MSLKGIQGNRIWEMKTLIKIPSC